MGASQKLTSAVLLILSLLLLPTTTSFRVRARSRSFSCGHSPIRKWEPASSPITQGDKKKGRPTHTHTRPLSRAEMKDAEARLSEMGYGTGRVDGVIDGVTRNALIAFQKYEGRKVTGQLSRADFDAIMNASAPQARDLGYSHVEVDLDRQVLLLTDGEGAVTRILPVSTGSNKHYHEKSMSGLAYTPRGRFRIYAKLSGWKKSPLGLLYYPNYFSDGLAIHGNPSVPQTPRSHGCIRIPMSAATAISRLLPVGTIVLIYDKESFVSAKDWAVQDRER